MLELIDEVQLEVIVPFAALLVAIMAALASWASAAAARKSERRMERSEGEALNRSVRLAAHRVMASADECNSMAAKTNREISSMSAHFGGSNASFASGHTDSTLQLIALNKKYASYAERSAERFRDVREHEKLFDELVRLEEIQVHMERAKEEMRWELDDAYIKNEAVIAARIPQLVGGQ